MRGVSGPSQSGQTWGLAKNPTAVPGVSVPSDGWNCRPSQGGPTKTTASTSDGWGCRLSQGGPTMRTGSTSDGWGCRPSQGEPTMRTGSTSDGWGCCPSQGETTMRTGSASPNFNRWKNSGGSLDCDRRHNHGSHNIN